MFEVHARVGQARIASLLTGSRKLATPNFVLAGMKGMPPHLTPDLLSAVPELRGFNMTAGDLLPLSPALKGYAAFLAGGKTHTDDTSASPASTPARASDAEVAAVATSPFHAMAQLQSHAVMLSLRNVALDGSALPAAKCPVVLSSSGQTRMPMSAFVDLVRAVRPDIVELPSEVTAEGASASKTEKVTKRNMGWLDEVLAEMKQQGVGVGVAPAAAATADAAGAAGAAAAAAAAAPVVVAGPVVFAPVDGGPFVDRRKAYSKAVAAKSGLVIHGYSINGASRVLPPLGGSRGSVPSKDPSSNASASAAPSTGGAAAAGDADEDAAAGASGSSSSPAPALDPRGYLSASLSGLPEAAPKLVNGLGEPLEVVDAVELGVDLVAAVYPLIATELGLALTFPVTLAELRAAAAANGNSNSIASSDASTTTAAAAAATSAAAAGAEAKMGDAPAAAAAAASPAPSPSPSVSPSASLAQRARDALDAADVPHLFINARRQEHREARGPLLAGCACYACARHSLGYVNHLLNASEMLAETLLMIHNAHHYARLFAAAREALAGGAEVFTEWAALARAVYRPHRLQMYNKRRVLAGDD